MGGTGHWVTDRCSLLPLFTVCPTTAVCPSFRSVVMAVVWDWWIMGLISCFAKGFLRDMREVTEPLLILKIRVMIFPHFRGVLGWRLRQLALVCDMFTLVGSYIDMYVGMYTHTYTQICMYIDSQQWTNIKDFTQWVLINILSSCAFLKFAGSTSYLGETLL